MKAVIAKKHGLPDVLEISEVPTPKPKDDEVLVKVYASSVNPVDTVLRKNRIFSYLITRGNMIIGSDLSGSIESVGEKVKALRNGDEVYGFKYGGATAEYATISEKRVAIKPSNMTFEQAAAVPLAGLTAFQALTHLARIRPSQRVLINGASGGVGTYATQIAESYGANVTGVTSSRNLKMVKTIGSDFTIDYTKNDFTELGEKYDIIFDAVAKSNFSKCKKILDKQGVYISTRISPYLLIQTILTKIYGSKKARDVRVNSNTKDLNSLRELIEKDKVKSIIEKTFTMEQSSEAHSHVEKGHTRGKVVITIN